MWFLHDGTGWALCCLAHGELAWHFQNHIQGWLNNLNMLLSCFREKIPVWSAECFDRGAGVAHTDLGLGVFLPVALSPPSFTTVCIGWLDCTFENCQLVHLIWHPYTQVIAPQEGYHKGCLPGIGW